MATSDKIKNRLSELIAAVDFKYFKFKNDQDLNLN